MNSIINGITIFILIIFFLNITLGAKFLDNFNVPCSYRDTVDLTNSTKFDNGSYLYDGILIPNNLVGIYNYHLVFNERQSAEHHVRGCICLIKTCLKWCCTPNSIMSNHSCNDINITLNTVITFQTEDYENITEDIYKHFYPIINEKPCKALYPLQPGHPEYDTDQWILFSNGSITTDGLVYTKNDYCLAANLIYNDTDFEVTPYLCFEDEPVKARDVLYHSTMILSVPFMLITIIIYMAIPELRNLHGIALSCYLLGLVFGYSIFGAFHYMKDKFTNTTVCTAFGYFCYFSFMSAFFWLSVISFDLWWNFRGIQGRIRFNDRKRFLCYALYAWGIPFLFLILSIIAQYSNIPIEFKPEIGHGHCWFEVEKNWSALIYFFGPLLILILINIAMFVMTSYKIHRVQTELSKMIAKEDSRKNFSTERDRFGYFFKLFVIMGVTWIMEIISYLLGPENSFNALFYVSDICNAMQGFIIFVLFVLKSKVKRLIKKRYKGTPSSSYITRSSQYSTKTQSYHMNSIGFNGPPTSTPLMEAPSFF